MVDALRALGLAYAFDYMNRTNNYYDMVERLEGHIRRWEETIDRLQRARTRVSENIESNTLRLSKAETYLDKLSSPSSIQWVERQKSTAENSHAPERADAARLKIDDYESRLSDTINRVDRLRDWISDGETKLREIDSRIATVEDKISSAKSKLR